MPHERRKNKASSKVSLLREDSSSPSGPANRGKGSRELRLAAGEQAQRSLAIKSNRSHFLAQARGPTGDG